MGNFLEADFWPALLKVCSGASEVVRTFSSLPESAPH